MSLLETGSKNIGRELTLNDVNYLGTVVSSAATVQNRDLWIAGLLATIQLLDVVSGRIASSEGARLRAEELLKNAYTILNFPG